MLHFHHNVNFLLLIYKKKEKVNEHFTNKISTHADLHWNISSSLGLHWLQHTPPPPPPPHPPPHYTLIPSQREWGESSSFRHAGGTWVCWKWGSEGGKRYFLLSAQRSCHLTKTSSLCQPVLPSSAHHLFYREQKQSSPWITPNQGFLFSPAFWQTTAKKSLWSAITVDSCISR